MKGFFWIFFLVFSCWAEASSGKGIPSKEIFFQFFNFSLFFIAFLFIIKKPVRNLYQKRRKDFLLFEEQAKKQRKDLEAKLQQWQTKIKELDVKEQTVKEDAEKEGKKWVAEKEKEITDLKKRLKSEEEFFGHLESEKIKRDSFKKWQKRIVERADPLLKKESLKPEVQQKFYQEFFKQIEEQQ